jgi:hypothetical protein
MAWTSQKSFTIDTFPYFYHVTAFHLPNSVFWTWHDTCIAWLNWSSWMRVCFIFCFAHWPGNLIFPWLLHLIINTVFCSCDAFIIGFWMGFILWLFSFLDNLVFNLALWLCLLYMLEPLEKLCDMAGFWLLTFITVVFFSRFKFTKVFGGNASQEHVYNDCVHELVKDFIGGQNCLLFAYGTSSAGKTYTIQGMLLFCLWFVADISLYII